MLDREVLRRHAPCLVVGAVGLVVQACAAGPALWAGDTDAAKYLALARVAPAHTLYDGRLYVMHPPLYPWAIRVVSLAGPSLPAAATLLSGLSAVALALATYALGRRWLEPGPAALAGLLVLASRGAAVLGTAPWREPFQTALLLAVLLAGLAEAPSRRRLALAAALGTLLGVTYDLFLLAAPALALGAWRLRRPGLAAAAGGVAVAWGAWAVVRGLALTAGDAYPAGIDGVVERTSPLPLLALVNPNALPLTSAHNAHFWPLGLTPQNALHVAAPWFTAPAGSPYLDLPAGAAQWLAGALLLGAALAGGLALVRGREPARGEVALLLALGLATGFPGLLGSQQRYALGLVPALALLAARAAAPGLARLDARGRAVALGAAGVGLVVAAAVTRPGFAPARPVVVEGEGIARALERPALARARVVVAPIGLVPDLTWLLPDRRVLTLPPDEPGARALLARLADAPALVVLPGFAPGDPRLPGVRAVHGAAAEGRAAHLGVVREGEVTDRPRERRFDVFWLGPGAPPRFDLLDYGARQ